MMNSSLSQKQLEESIQTWRIDLSIQAATTTWFLYDYLLTLPDEIRCIWQRQLSAVTVVFLTLRYAALMNLLNAVQNFVYWANFPDGGIAACTLIWRLNAVTEALVYFSLVGYVSIRVYAISDRNLRVACIVCALSTCFVISDGYRNNIGGFLPRPAPTSGCLQMYVLDGHVGEVYGNDRALNKPYATIALIGTLCLFTAELIVQFYAWRSTWQIHRAIRHRGGQRSVILLLVQDGTTNFLLVTIWAVVADAISSIDLQIMSISVVSVCLCRVLLRLRQIRFAEDPENFSGTMSRISTRFVANMGAPIAVSSMVQDDAADEHDETEDVIYVHGNPLMVDLESDRVHV